MILIIEGPDGAGKTTLCHELGDRLNAPVYKPVGNPHNDGMTTLESQAHDRGAIGVLATVAGQADIVMDRSFPSEWVYSTHFKRDFDQSLVWELDRLVASVPHLGILLTYEDANVGWACAMDRMSVDDFEPVDWKPIHGLYRRYVDRSLMRWFEVDAGMLPSMVLELVMVELVRRREQIGSRRDVYMDMARSVARRSTCISRRVGSIIVSANGHVIATGYNGAPARFPHPTSCPRLLKGARSGECLEECNDVHAEENALVQAALSGATPSGGSVYTTSSPCTRCARMLVNAGIVEVIYEKEYDPGALDLLAQAHIDTVQV